MEEQGALIFAHISMSVAALLPAMIMRFVDLDKPNKYMGYRTPWSMKSELTWRYANKTSAIYMLWSGVVTVTIQLATYFIVGSLTSLLITTVALMVGIIISMIVTEMNLRKKFNKDGTLKNEFDDLD